MQRTLGFKERI